MTPKFTLVDTPPTPAMPQFAGGKYVSLFDALRQMPGQWVKLDEPKYSSFVASVKQGKLVGAEKGEFDATIRNLTRAKGGKGDIYIRYIGTPGAES